MQVERRLFEVQDAFAHRVSQITGVSLLDAYRLHTCFYGWIANDNDAGSPPQRWDFRPDHRDWLAFASTLEGGDDPVAYAYARYRDSLPQGEADEVCFKFEYWPDMHWVRLHFENSPDGMALRPGSRSTRLAELRNIFSDVAAYHPEAVAVRGTSWLYHVPAYRNLFPSAFGDGLQSAGYLHQFLALWGQFLDRHGRVKEGPGESFLDAIQRADTMQGLNECFPYDVLANIADISAFYTTFQVTAPTPH